MILLSLVSLTVSVFGQQGFCSWYEISFEPNPFWGDCPTQLVIDTISDTNNVWQIGTPSKTLFDSAHSAPKAILTDTLYPYPPNDTSYFVVINGAEGGGLQSNHTYSLEGYYRSNTDSLNDYGMIEFSPDNGNLWIDILNDTVYNSVYWWNDKPVLTGNSDGWKYFYCNLASLGQFFEFGYSDTVLYRFTFISDSNPDTLDGIMFDDLQFHDYVESVQEYERISSKAFPNPANKSLTIEFENLDFSMFNLVLTDGFGRLVFSKKLNQQKIHFETDKLADGIYYYSLTNVDKLERAWGKFVVLRE